MHGLMPSATTILLVAVREARRIVVAQQLEALGYSVIAVLYNEALGDVLARTKYDLLVVDLSGSESTENRTLAERAAELLNAGTPVLMLSADQQLTPEVWTQETLGYRIGAALRNRNAADVLSARAVHWEGLNVLDPETMLFSRRYFDAIFPLEIERSRRVNQPMSLLLIQLDGAQLSTAQWRMVSARLLSSLRQTDILVRYQRSTVLVVLPVTETIMARAVAARLFKALSSVALDDGQQLAATIGIAAYPQHGSAPGVLLSSAQHALNHAIHPGAIVSFDQV